MAIDPVSTLVDALTQALSAGTFVKLTLAKPLREGDAKNLFVRAVVLKAGPRLQLVERQVDRDLTSNLTYEDGIPHLGTMLGARFAHAHLFTTNEELTLELEADRKPKLRRRPTTTAGAPSPHDGRPTAPRWLEALGPADADKRTQVARFTEILGHLLADIPKSDRARLVDMGCGRGVLTFAAREALEASGRTADVTGVELRAHLVDKANAVVADQHIAGLRFVQAAIADAPLEGADIVVALHACDTATDDALARAIRAGAQLIVVAPCCHKELRPRLGRPAPLAPALKHGLLVERQSEWLTDALRAQVLELEGYHTRVFEFVSNEHTAKNVMIAATKRTTPVDRDAKLAELRALSAFYGIEHQHLVDTLGIDLQGSGAG